MELWDRVEISREEYENSIKDFIEKEKLQQRIDKAIEMYEDREKYKKKRFMENKSIADLMYEILKGE